MFKLSYRGVRGGAVSGVSSGGGEIGTGGGLVRGFCILLTDEKLLVFPVVPPESEVAFFLGREFRFSL